MALQFSTAIRNGWLDLIESTIGTSAILEVRTGAPPATCATAASGTLLASMTLPSDWMAAAASGSVSKLGTWSDTAIDATGTPGHFRIYNSAGTICGMQGTATVEGGGGDMEVDVVPLVTDGLATVTVFTLTAPGG
jgi:hypothetical protein